LRRPNRAQLPLAVGAKNVGKISMAADGLKALIGGGLPATLPAEFLCQAGGFL
jgi:hypothetical protein